MTKRMSALAGAILIVVAAITTLVGGFGLGGSAIAGAATNPAPITDYANYPDGITPAIWPNGCNAASGANVVVGDTYSVNGGAASVSLQNVATPVPGDVVTMTWTGFVAGCESSGVSLSLKRADVPVFDATTNQELIGSAYAYCGPGGDACAPVNGVYSLSFTVPSRKVACNFQIDSVVGPPLAVIGPDGSFYNSQLRHDLLGQTNPGHNMLIDSFNGGPGDCGAPQPDVSTVMSCDDGGALVFFTNDGELDATFTLTVNGQLIDTFDVAPRTQQGPGTAQRLVPIAEDDTAHITITSEGQTLVDRDFTRDCEQVPPRATITSDCDSGASVILDNPTPIEHTFVVSVDGIPTDHVVAAFSAEKVTVPVDAGQSVSVTVSMNGQTLADQTVGDDCVPPKAVITAECSSSGADISVTNDADTDTTVVVLVDGEVVASVPVAAHSTTPVTLPIDEDASVTVSVNTADNTEIASLDVTRDCQPPVAATVAMDCQREPTAGVVVTVSSSGDTAQSVNVFKDDDQVDTIELAAGATETRVYAMEEDATATFTVTTPDDVVLTTEDVTFDCNTVEGAVLNPPAGPSALPATGMDLKGYLVMAGLLVILGGAFVALSTAFTRRVPARVRVRTDR